MESETPQTFAFLGENTLSTDAIVITDSLYFKWSRTTSRKKVLAEIQCKKVKYFYFVMDLFIGLKTRINR